MSAFLIIDHVSISFPTDKGPLQVLEQVKLEIQQGEFVSLIGHSGCGKSRVLNIVAGLLRATEGGVVLEEKEVTDPGPDRAVVFQQHSLLPWLAVYDNVRLAVDQPGVRQDQIQTGTPRLDPSQPGVGPHGARPGAPSGRDLRGDETARRHRPGAQHGA